MKDMQSMILTGPLHTYDCIAKYMVPSNVQLQLQCSAQKFRIIIIYVDSVHPLVELQQSLRAHCWLHPFYFLFWNQNTEIIFMSLGVSFRIVFFSSYFLFIFCWWRLRTISCAYGFCCTGRSYATVYIRLYYLNLTYLVLKSIDKYNVKIKVQWNKSVVQYAKLEAIRKLCSDYCFVYGMKYIAIHILSILTRAVPDINRSFCKEICRTRKIIVITIIPKQQLVNRKNETKRKSFFHSIATQRRYYLMAMLCSIFLNWGNSYSNKSRRTNFSIQMDWMLKM